MLDIGNGWGRWLVSGFNKGYIPIGIDIRLEFCKTAINTLHANNCLGYSLVADLKNLPFKDNIFDFVWSFSVIQHTHKSRMISCLKHINRILKSTGFSKLEFPNKNGVYNNINNVSINNIIDNAIESNNPDIVKLLIDRTSLSIGLETSGGIMDILIPRGSIIPIKKIKKYKGF